jgi:ornithine decarboxylase
LALFCHAGKPHNFTQDFDFTTVYTPMQVVPNNWFDPTPAETIGGQPSPLGYLDTRDYLLHEDSDQPVLLFCPQQLASTVSHFHGSFHGTTTYAVKANPELEVLRALYRSGVTQFDAASLGEIKLLRTEFPEASINYNNPIRCDADLAQAYTEYSVRSFVIDDASGLAQLKRFCADDIELTVRFKLDHENAAYDFGSKFGADADTAVTLLIAANKSFKKLSLTFHPGSQCTSPEVYKKYIEAAAVISSQANVTLHRLNVGGGFPLAYENAKVAQLQTYFRGIHEAVSEYFGDTPTQLVCEPGRALVGSSCSLLCEVIHVRDNGDVFINDGLYGSLQEQFLMDSQLPIKMWRDGSTLQVDGPPRHVFGPTCDPSDKLAGCYTLAASLKPGDKIEFGLLGAYGSATATQFNGIDPARYVLVRQGFHTL